MTTKVWIHNPPGERSGGVEMPDDVYDKAVKLTEELVDERIAEHGPDAFYAALEKQSGRIIRDGPKSEWRGRAIQLMVAVTLEGIARENWA